MSQKHLFTGGKASFHEKKWQFSKNYLKHRGTNEPLKVLTSRLSFFPKTTTHFKKSRQGVPAFLVSY
jgi:hypothetical protein